MKDYLLHPDIALMNLVLDISKKTSSIVTIKNGKIVLSNGNISIEFEFFNNDSHQVVFSDKDECWHFYISITKFSETNLLEKTIIFVLGSDCENKYHIPVVSIPRILYFELSFSQVISLDYAFKPTINKSLIKYSIVRKNKKCYFHMFYNQMLFSKTEVIIIPRDGIGNESL